MSLRLAQITDCHFTAKQGQRLHGIDVDATLAKVIELLRRWQPERLLITGDLSDRGDPASYQRLRKAVRGLGVPINAIPGNHDIKHNLHRHFIGGKNRFEATIKSTYWDLILIDSSLAGQDAGHLGRAQLRSLIDSLQRSGKRPKMVFLHHHPLPIGDQWLDDMRLNNAAALWSVLSTANGVKALVCGHIHQVVETEHQRIQVLSTPSTASQARPGQTEFVDDDLGPGFRWFELHADGNWDTGVIRTLESSQTISG